MGLIMNFKRMKRAWQKMPQKTMYKSLTCEFHQTNNLDKFYTDEKQIYNSFDGSGPDFYCIRPVD